MTEPAPAPFSRVFVDVTRTARENTYTGIQKVVRSAFRGLSLAGAERGFEVVPVIVEAGAAFRLPGLAPHPYETGESLPPAPEPAGPAARLLALARRHRQNPVLAPARLAVRALLAATRGWRLRLRYGAPLRFGPGDVFLMPDAAWVADPWPVVVQLHQAGGRVVAIWYDVIPVTHPHYFEPALAESFAGYLSKILARTNLIICISATVRDELAAMAQARGFGPSIVHAYPPSRLAQAARTPHPVLAGAFRRPTALIVATLEPRKGHALLLDAVERLWRDGRDLDLLIVGRVGWKAEALIARLDAHPERGRRLHRVHQASDGDIAYALARAHVLVLPSQAEGLGLPILEAGLAGCPVLCSDIPVFREIAGAQTRFFSPFTPEALAEALDPMLQGEAGRLPPAPPAPEAADAAYGRALADRLAASGQGPA